MVLALPILVGLAVAVLLGGRLQALGELRLRGIGIFFVAIAIQVVAFPFPPLPWKTPGGTASALWISSYGLLLVAALLNRQIVGVPIIALGLVSNLAAVLANGGRMPVRPEAMRAAGHDYVVHQNSAATENPSLGPLIDRWAAPEWVPLANVYSVGDLIVGFGGFVLVLAATGALARVRNALGLRRSARSAALPAPSRAAAAGRLVPEDP